MRVHFLGTGGAFAEAGRGYISLLLETPERLVLIDCSGAPAQAVLKTGADLWNLTDVILTHAHPDHIHGVPALAHAFWLHERGKEGRYLTFHALESVNAAARALLDVFGLIPKMTDVTLHWENVSDSGGRILSLADGWEITGFPVNHRGNAAQGVKISKDGKTRLVYSGDGEADEAVAKHIEDGTILIQDCGAALGMPEGHASAAQAGRMIAGTGVRDVYPVHLPPLSDADRAKVLATLQEDFDGCVHDPKDGDVIEL